MTQVKPDASILEKIKKLLALADGNQNEHEREVAMQFAMDLLAKHNLSIGELQAAELEMAVGEVRVNLKLDPWVRRVLSAACALYYTDFYMSAQYDYWGERKTYTPVFVGTTENVAVTIEVASWLLNSIRIESNRAYKDGFERRSFRLGAADKVLERAMEMIQAEKLATPSTPGTSLMVLRNRLQQANEKHLEQLNLKQFKARSSYIDHSAYADGEEFGNNVQLDKQTRTKVRAALPDFSLN